MTSTAAATAFLLSGALLLLMLFSASGCATPQGDTVADQRDYVQNMASEALDDGYAQEPELREKVNNAPGFGVFSNIGTNILLVSTGGGYGIVHNNLTGEDTYMRMGELGVGPGLGVRDFRAIMIFNDEETMREFVNTGWTWGAEAEAAAKSGDQGGAAQAEAVTDEDIEVYQFTESGLIVGATLSGTRFWPDDDLN